MKALLLLFAVSAVLCAAPFPQWPSKYTASVMWQVPNSIPPINEEIEIYYDPTSSSESLVYYDGVAKDIIRTDKDIEYQIHIENNVKVCSLKKGSPGPSGDGKIAYIPILPDFSAGNWTYQGQAVIRGILCDKFYMENWELGVKNGYYFYTYEKDKTVTPMRWEMFGFNIVFGSHYDHYIMDFMGYWPNEITDPDAFTIPEICTQNLESLEKAKKVSSRHQFEGFHIGFERHIDNEFNQFKLAHEKNYRSFEEHDYRKRMFVSRKRMIEQHNLDPKNTYTLGMNEHADKSISEIRAKFLQTDGFSKVQEWEKYPNRRSYKPSPGLSVPDKIDWRDKGAVAKIKDQATCGSCWAFSAIAALESANFIATNKMTLLSEQDLVDCAGTAYGAGQNHGCFGGLFDDAYEYIIQNGNGVNTEDDYPYIAINGQCAHVAKTAVAAIDYYVNVTSRDTDALCSAIAEHGPVAVAIDVTEKFVFYRDGVFTDPTCKTEFGSLNHGVNIVGYDKAQNAWIGRNSWSKLWGNEGYFMMKMGDGDCGVTTIPEFPHIKQ